MFKGDAEVIVAEATVVLALQEYFERRTLFGFTPIIKSIALDTRSYGPEGRRFKIEMTENDKSLDALPPAAQGELSPE